MGLFSFLFKNNVEKSSDIIINDSILINTSEVSEQTRFEIPWIGNYPNYNEYCEAYRKYLESGVMSVKVEIEGLNFKRYRKDGTFWYESLPPKPTVDKRESFCPNCQHQLEKIPDRKKKCPHCGKQIYTYADKGIKKLRSEEEGKAHYEIVYTDQANYTESINSPEYLNAELDKMQSPDKFGFHYTRAVLNTAGPCDNCGHMRGQIFSIEDAHRIIGLGHPLVNGCDCNFWFSPDLSSRISE